MDDKLAPPKFNRTIHGITKPTKKKGVTQAIKDLLNEGWTPTEIRNELGCGEDTVYVVKSRMKKKRKD